MRTLFTDCFIYTGDRDHRCIADGAILVDDRRIAWLGPRAEAPPGAERVERLGGRVVMPGMINTHAHGGLTVHRGQSDDGDLFQWAAAVAPFTSTLTLADNRWGCYVAIMEQVRAGITTVCDCARYGADIFSDVASEIGIRSLSGALANSPSLRTVGRPNWPSAREETLAASERRGGNGLCRFYMGAHSPYNCTPELLLEIKREAEAHDMPFVIHAAENRTEVERVRERHGKRPVEYLRDLGLLDRRAVLAHCVWLDDDEIDMLARSGAGVAHNPISNAKLASGIARVPEMRRRGVKVGLGTDSSLSNNSLSLFQEMKVAILLQRASTLDGNALSARDALAMATLDGARVLCWDDEIGSLEPGKQADLVVLSLDHPLGYTPQRALSDIVYAAGPQHVSRVIVAGETIYADGRFMRIDEAGLRDRMRAHFAARMEDRP